MTPTADSGGRYRPRVLDLFCGAGGAAMGYHQAGFAVVGVDIKPQPHYPFEFHQADAMTFPLDGFDAVHASPPCQDHSTLSALHAEHGTGWMLAATVDRMRPLTVPWVVENVVGPTVLMDGWWFTLCGSMFALTVRRHRRFGSNLLILTPECRHDLQGQPIGVYGHGGGEGGPNRPPAARRGPRIAWKATAQEARDAMGIDWMTRAEIAQAIPPAYTEWIGVQLLAALERAA
jgi:DNA (cytosine-5)-methyltransferase 1